MRTPRPWLFLPAAFVLGGCAAAPTLDVFGSYFPAWMACIVIGLLATVVARLLLIGLGIDAHLRPKAVINPCLALLFTLAAWLIFFKG